MRHERTRNLTSAGLVTLLVAALAPAALLVPAARAETILVTTTVDGGPGSLRAAFDAANASPGDDVIELAPDTTYQLTICGPSEDANATGDLEHRQVTTLTIHGNGSTIRQLCSSGAIGAERPAGTLRIEDLTISDVPRTGVFARGRLELTRSALLGNGAEEFGSSFGGLYGRDVRLVDSTIAHNEGWELGAVTFDHSLEATNTTIFGNVGGGIVGLSAAGDLTAIVRHSTVFGNRGLGSGGTPKDLHINAFRGTRFDVDVEASVFGVCDMTSGMIELRSFGGNVEPGVSCGFDHPSDVVDVGDLGLGDLADNGGPTPTLLPLPGSPLIDRVPQCAAAGLAAQDQRGEPRPMGLGCDAGAVETAGTPPIDVTSAAASGPGSLRAAVGAANTAPGFDSIRLDPDLGLYDLGGCGEGDEDGNISGDLDSTDALAILGRGATITSTCAGPAIEAIAGDLRLRDLTVDGGGVLGLTVDVQRSVVRNATGPGIELAETSSVVDSTIEDNAGPGVLLHGGCASGDWVEVTGSLISGNAEGVRAPTPHVVKSSVVGNGPGPDGGGIIGLRNATVIASTVHDNTALSAGAGVRLLPCESYGGVIELIQSTVTSNSAPTGGANVHGPGHALVAIGSVIAEAGGGGADCETDGSLDMASFDGDGSCELAETADSISAGGDPMLGPLADNGIPGPFAGAPLTRLPQIDSPLVDAYWGCVEDDFEPVDAVDQRGAPRSQGAWCDMGAVEVEQPATFVDVPYGYPFVHEIECLVDSGAAQGFPDDTFRPRQYITREAVATWLWRLFGSPAPIAPVAFSDVSPTSPFAPAIAWLAEAGITEGYPDGTFHPTAKITREAVSAWLARAAGSPGPTEPNPFSDVSPASPFADDIAYLAEIDVAAGWPDGTFRPTQKINREALAAWVCRFEHADVVPVG